MLVMVMVEMMSMMGGANGTIVIMIVGEIVTVVEGLAMTTGGCHDDAMVMMGEMIMVGGW
jgi:hypothetical protein